jgi:hypothetical protein
MYKIERRPSGFLLTFAGKIPQPEMSRWLEESKTQLQGASGAFGVIIDMRTLSPIDGETQAVMVEGQALYKKHGMARSAVILANAVVTQQFKRLAQESGIYSYERYIDASMVTDWSDVAVAWVRNGIDPDA